MLVYPTNRSASNGPLMPAIAPPPNGGC